uniref:Uncharacterized protein n=1 Tax=Anopheles farauti TaxID=69004 RepID=A0A182QYS5_9DIPT
MSDFVVAPCEVLKYSRTGDRLFRFRLERGGGGTGGRFLLECLGRVQRRAELERVAALVLPVGAGRGEQLFARVEALFAGQLEVLSALLQILRQVGHVQPSDDVRVGCDGSQVTGGGRWQRCRCRCTYQSPSERATRTKARSGGGREERQRRRDDGKLTETGQGREETRISGGYSSDARKSTVRRKSTIGRKSTGRRSEWSERSKQRAGHEPAGHQQQQQSTTEQLSHLSSSSSSFVEVVEVAFIASK